MLFRDLQRDRDGGGPLDLGSAGEEPVTGDRCHPIGLAGLVLVAGSQGKDKVGVLASHVGCESAAYVEGVGMGHPGMGLKIRRGRSTREK